MKVAVLDDYGLVAKKLNIWDQLHNSFEISFFDHPQPVNVLAQFECLIGIRERTIFNKHLLSQLPELKHLALTGRVSTQADLEYARQNGIAVSFTRGSGRAPSEHAIALIMAASKSIVGNHNGMLSGKWQNAPSYSLENKTLGILGLGRIGKTVAVFGKLMGMNVISAGINQESKNAQELQIARVSLEDLFASSDILSIHLKLSPQTTGLVNETLLDKMKPNALLVNTARAKIIDMPAMYKKINSGRIRVALDVFEEEPFMVQDIPALYRENVLLSPHMGYVTEEVYHSFFIEVIENLNNWLHNRAYRSALTVKE